jgi:hypothetical protein
MHLPHQSPRISDFLGWIAIAAIGVALGVSLRPRPEHKHIEANAPAARAVATNSSVSEGAKETPDTATSPTPSPGPPPAAVPAKSVELPPKSQGAAKTYAELAPRAHAGDIKAARRLADDLQQCAQKLQIMEMMANVSEPVANMSEGELADFEATQQGLQAQAAGCEGLTRAQSLEAADLLRQAALGGDGEAALCSAMNPADFRSIDVLSPAWRRYARRWQEEAPGMAERALLAGIPEAANLLAAMNSAVGDFSATGARGLLGDHPDRAYLYTRIYLDHAAAGRMQASAQAALNEHGARLDAATRATLDAQARALEARIAFEPPIWNRLDHAQGGADCRHLRAHAGMAQ